MSEHNRAHAVLSPSSAERWLTCPASVALISTLDRADDSGSEWAEEGTRAHTLAEIEASYAFDLISVEDYRTRRTAWLRVAESHGDDVEEMERHVRTYVSMVGDTLATMEHATVRLEQRVQTGVPGCWGTGDAILVSPTRIHVIDFKYGQGVVVRAEDNPQLMLYGVGALEMFDGVVGDAETVGMSICQPRAGGMSHFYMDARELRLWRDDYVMPIARETQHPDARFGPSETACRWCPAAGICKPRMEHIVRRDFGSPDVMDEVELADAVRSLSEIRDWCNAVEAEALDQAYSEGKVLPGLKVVLSGGKRSIPDAAAAIEALVGAGYDRDKVARVSVQTITHLERLVGRGRLPEVLGDLLVKSEGRPSLVPEDDPREPVSKLAEAKEDFRDQPGD